MGIRKHILEHPVAIAFIHPSDQESVEETFEIRLIHLGKKITMDLDSEVRLKNSLN